jgi:hypothetical protein
LFILDSGYRIRILIFYHPGSKGQNGTGARIPNPDPQPLDSIIPCFPWIRIDWPKGYKPLDEPLCGYRGEKCKGSQGRTEIAAGVLGGLLVFALIVTLSVYRKWKIEQARSSASWIKK